MKIYKCSRNISLPNQIENILTNILSVDDIG